MYAVIGRFAFRAAPDATLLARVEGEIVDPLSKLPGFQTLHVIRTTDTEACVVHLWESQAEAEQGLQLLFPRVQQLAAEGLVGPAERSMGEVVMVRSAAAPIAP